MHQNTSNGEVPMAEKHLHRFVHSFRTNGRFSILTANSYKDYDIVVGEFISFMLSISIINASMSY